MRKLSLIELVVLILTIIGAITVLYFVFRVLGIGGMLFTILLGLFGLSKDAQKSATIEKKEYRLDEIIKAEKELQKKRLEEKKKKEEEILKYFGGDKQ